MARTSRSVDVPLNRRRLAPLPVAGHQQGRPSVFVLAAGVIEPEVVTEDRGDFVADTNVALAFALVLERGLGLRTVTNAKVGSAPVLKVVRVERVQRTPAHPGLPEEQDDDVPEGSVLVLVKILDDLGRFVLRQHGVSDLLGVIGFGDADHHPQVLRNGVDVFAEADEVLHAGHVGLERDCLDLLLSPLFELLDVVAGEVVEVREVLVFEPADELPQGRLVV